MVTIFTFVNYSFVHILFVDSYANREEVLRKSILLLEGEPEFDDGSSYSHGFQSSVVNIILCWT